MTYKEGDKQKKMQSVKREIYVDTQTEIKNYTKKEVKKNKRSNLYFAVQGCIFMSTKIGGVSPLGGPALPP